MSITKNDAYQAWERACNALGEGDTAEVRAAAGCGGRGKGGEGGRGNAA